MFIIVPQPLFVGGLQQVQESLCYLQLHVLIVQQGAVANLILGDGGTSISTPSF